MSTTAVLVALAVVLLASICQTATGFGFALMGVPLLAMTMPSARAVIVVALVSAPLSWIRVYRERADIDRRAALPLIGWSLAGMPFGLLLLKRLPDDPLRLLIGCVVLALAVALASGWTMQRTGPAVDAGTGFISGVLNTSTGTNGPPLVIALHARRMAPARQRATLAAVFSVTGVVSLALFWRAGRITSPALRIAAIAYPLMLLGNVVGMSLGRRLSARGFHHAVIVLLFASATAAIVTALA